MQLKEKIDENKKIRNDLFALQGRTPPRNNDIDINDLRRRYISQIETLETLNIRLQVEQEKLEENNKSLSEKVSYQIKNRRTS